LSHAHRSPRTRGRWGFALVLGLIAALGLALLPSTAAAKEKGKVGHTLNVMTRNLYLGADLGPALEASSINGAVDAAFQIEQQVHRTKFPSVRAALLAKEIQKRRPDVVGIQEGAWWRTGPYDLSAIGNPKATQTDPLGGNFLPDLLTKLNKKPKGKKAKKGFAPYRIAVVKTEFDYELPVNQGSGGLGACPSQCHNERLTMRDAILVRKGVKTSKASSGTFNALLQEKVGGVLPVTVTRGWAAVNVKIHDRKFHVVDTHFESFDSQASNSASDGKTYPKGGIREAQAKQLVGAGGPASRPKTILVGDLNSNFPVTGDQVFPGDALAYQAVLAAGFKEKSAPPPPFSCCIGDPNLTTPTPVGVTHKVDHIMANTKKVKFKKGAVTSTFANGLWSSDHFGVFSQLLIK
jgi:hypothetical protein